MTEEKNSKYVVVKRELIEERMKEYQEFLKLPTDLTNDYAREDRRARIDELNTILSHSQLLSVFEQKAFEAGRKQHVHAEGLAGERFVYDYSNFDDYSAKR